jgi:MFS family permease
MAAGEPQAGTPAILPSARAAAWALTVLTVLNFVNYMDRQVLPAVLTPLHQDPALRGATDAQLGFLQTGFLLVYMLVSPLGGALGARIPRKYIAAAGVFVWSMATLWSGLARSYNELLAARTFIGFGEAGYAAVAPVIIADLFSPDRRARMLAVFYTATPVGSALGFIVGGLVAEHFGWRPAFFVAGAPGFVFAVLALFIVEPARTKGANRPEGGATWAVLTSERWWYVTVGGALMTFTLGGLAFWTPTYFQEARALSVGRANLLFGGTTVVGGLVGTFAGGFLGDAWHKRDRGGYMKLSGIGLMLGAPLALLAPYAPGLTLSLAVFFLAEVFVFLNTGPLNAALVASISPEQRELAVGLNILAIHLGGDAISPPLLGKLRDVLVGRAMAPVAARAFSVAAMAVPLLLGGIVLLIGARSFRRE